MEGVLLIAIGLAGLVSIFILVFPAVVWRILHPGRRPPAEGEPAEPSEEAIASTRKAGFVLFFLVSSAAAYFLSNEPRY
jgi:hypothetical protein